MKTKMKRAVPIIASALVAIGVPAMAADAPVACFEIVAPAEHAGWEALMLNKCTGASWILVRSTVYRGGKPTDDYAYRWFPVVVSRDEAEIHTPTMSELNRRLSK